MTRFIALGLSVLALAAFVKGLVVDDIEYTILGFSILACALLYEMRADDES